MQKNFEVKQGYCKNVEACTATLPTFNIPLLASLVTLESHCPDRKQMIYVEVSFGETFYEQPKLIIKILSVHLKVHTCCTV